VKKTVPSLTNTINDQSTIEEALLRLFDAGWERNGGPMVSVSRHWPNEVAVDTVVVVSAELTSAQRDTPTRGMVRRKSGTVGDVIDAVLDWPPPGAPDEVPLPSHRKDFT
jgi:hypothetical protein